MSDGGGDAAAVRCDRSWWERYRRGGRGRGGAAAATRAAPRCRPADGAGLDAFEGAPCWDHDRAQGRDAESR